MTGSGSELRRAYWRDVLERQASSGLSAAAFCKSEGIAVPTFYGWRARLRDVPAPQAVPFIDLGATAETAIADAGIEIRLDLGHGMTLTIARR
jgi:hypothetical protein